MSDLFVYPKNAQDYRSASKPTFSVPAGTSWDFNIPDIARA